MADLKAVTNPKFGRHLELILEATRRFLAVRSAFAGIVELDDCQRVLG